MINHIYSDAELIICSNLETTSLQKNECNRRGLKHKAGIETRKLAIMQFLNDTIRLSLKTTQ